MSAQQLPDGFSQEVVYTDFSSPAGILHADTNVSFVWELGGRVWLIKDDVKFPTPVIDIAEEVAHWGDLGMIGAVLHPDFLTNGYIYLFYAVDRHHLLKFGTPAYNPDASEQFTSSMGRITRYTLNTVDFQFAIPNSRYVLLGEAAGDGNPICTPSHGVGTLAFGEDGSLLASTGDGSTWVGGANGYGYNGSGPVPEFGYDSLALADGILSSDQLLGSYRAQYLDGLNGKVLRMDPETGNGLPNNPFYDASNPDGARSKVWSMGLRNPYRFTVKPGTGQGTMNDGFPGVLLITDVGDWVWEEINVAEVPGQNFGWPLFQGPSIHNFYWMNTTLNSNAPNPLHGSSNCNKPFFNYQETVIQSNANHDYFLPNSCNPAIEIPSDVITFIHSRPLVSYANEANTGNPYAVTSTYNEAGDATYCIIGDPECGVEGGSFIGLSASGSAILMGDRIPVEYQGWQLHLDFTGWLRAIKLNELSEPEKIEYWIGNLVNPININFNTFNGCAYVTSVYPAEIRRICFGANLNPIVSVTPELVYGASPIEVQFSTVGTYDPEGDPLSCHWDFGDGNISIDANPTHTFVAATSQTQNYTVTLSVADTSGGQTQVLVPVSLNNTPPAASIISIEDGELYGINLPTGFNLVAEVSDDQSAPGALEYLWEIRLNHNTHFHIMSTESGNNAYTSIAPTGCSENETYWYEIRLRVTDPGGLTAYDSKMIYPDCDNTLGNVPLPDGKNYLLLPNPVSDWLEVRSIIPFGDSFDFEIYDYQGRRMTHESLPVYNSRQYVKLNVSLLNSGMYILKMKIADEWYSEPFIKADY